MQTDVVKTRLNLIPEERLSIELYWQADWDLAPDTNAHLFGLRNEKGVRVDDRV